VGAFWFYYNMGFRPEDRKLLDLANREAEKKLLIKLTGVI
jgi:hypothetical protein